MRLFLLVLLIPITAAAQSVRVDGDGYVRQYVRPSEEALAEYELAIEVFNACLHRGKALQPCPKPERPAGQWSRAEAPPVADSWEIFGVPIRWAGDPHACSLAATDRVPNQLFCARDSRDRPTDPERADRPTDPEPERVDRPEPPAPQPPPEPKAGKKGKRHGH